MPAVTCGMCGEVFFQWAVVDSGSASGLIALSDAAKVSLIL